MATKRPGIPRESCGFTVAHRPVIDVKFSGGKGPGAKPLAVEIRDIEGQTGSLVVTVFDKYQASYRISLDHHITAPS